MTAQRAVRAVPRGNVFWGQPGAGGGPSSPCASSLRTGVARQRAVRAVPRGNVFWGENRGGTTPRWSKVFWGARTRRNPGPLRGEGL
jgi:hypothetical protein